MKQATFRFSMNLSICKRTPRRSSRTNSLLWQGIFVTSKICEPSLGSDTPKLNLDFFPTLGRLSDKKLCSSSVIWPTNLHSTLVHIFTSTCSKNKRLKSINCNIIRLYKLKNKGKIKFYFKTNHHTKSSLNYKTAKSYHLSPTTILKITLTVHSVCEVKTII